MIEYNFYEYYESNDKLKIYGDEISNFFIEQYNIIIDSIDFDSNQNVILYIEDIKNKSENFKIEKDLLEKFKHLNDVEIRLMKIILTFDCREIELC